MAPNDARAGPGYATPADAQNAEKEQVVYVPCVHFEQGKKDYLSTVCVDPESPNYSKVIHRLPMLHNNDELHHSGWNTCASCHGIPSSKRDKLILPSLGSSRIYVIDTSDRLEPKIHAVVEPEELKSLGTGYLRPHTSHCMSNGDVLVSTMGDANDDAKGGFVVLDGNTWKLKGTWHKEDDAVSFGYDFWYQYKFDTMISTEFGAPRCWWKNFNPADVGNKDYGQRLHVWSFKEKKVLYDLDLGDEGLIPLEIRFLHDPEKPVGFVGCALSSSVFRFTLDEESGKWTTKKVIQVNPKTVEGWALPNMPGLITDILLSMDDRYLYFSNWIQGDVRQYDISDTENPKLVGQVWLGGSCKQGSSVKVTHDEDLTEQPPDAEIQGRKIYGGPQMLQLSLDGKRLYITESLLTPWDRQFYPDLIKYGGTMLQVDVDNVNGGLKLNEKFLVDFGKEPDGPVVCHEVRYPGGDCSSDIYLPKEMLEEQQKSGKCCH